MNLRKTSLWLALTGWLPWACYFGRHERKRIAFYREIPFEDLVRWRAMTPMKLWPVGHWWPRGCVCKRCGRAW